MLGFFLVAEKLTKKLAAFAELQLVLTKSLFF
jgi:hypothetical protein